MYSAVIRGKELFVNALPRSGRNVKSSFPQNPTCLRSCPVTFFMCSVPWPSFFPMTPLIGTPQITPSFMSSFVLLMVKSSKIAGLLMYRFKKFISNHVLSSKQTSCDAHHRPLCYEIGSRMSVSSITKPGILSSTASLSCSMIVGLSAARLKETFSW